MNASFPAASPRYPLNPDTIRQRIPQLQQCMEQATADNANAGSSLLVLQKGQELIYLESGFASFEDRRPITRDAIFRCYSMTKPITACAVFLLIEDGLLDLYDPVSRYIDTFCRPRVATPEGDVPAAREIVILDLLNMTAGLCYGGTDSDPARETEKIFEEAIRRLDTGDPMTTMEFAERIGRCPLLFHPGSSWNYSVCADILGAVVEKISGQPFASFVKERILDPLDMRDTGFEVPADQRYRLVTAYQNDPTVLRENPALANAEGWLGQGYAPLIPYRGNHLAIRNDGGENPFHSGGAGLFSTIDDYAKFGMMLIQGGAGQSHHRVLRETTVRYMTDHGQFGPRQAGFDAWPGLEGFTYGNLLRVARDPSLACVPCNAGEYGWDGWLGTFFCNDPATGTTFLLMQNQKDSGTTCFTRRIRSLLYL